jgi:hypothetical protein
MQDLCVHKHAFQPKDHAEAHTVSLSNDTASGYDLVLFIDRQETATSDSGFMLELGINADGSIGGQVTAHPGYDPLAVFGCTPDTLTISDATSGATHVITDREPEAVPSDRTAYKDFTLNMTPMQLDALLLLVDKKASSANAAEMWGELRAQLISHSSNERNI